MYSRNRHNDRRETLAAEYLAAIERKERTLVVAQTREEVRNVNEAIRQKLQDAGMFGAETSLTTHQPIDLSKAQKRDVRFCEEGQHAYFNRGYGRFTRGDTCSIVGANDRGVVLQKNAHKAP